MAQQSFPVIEQNMNADQWKSVTLGIGDGILDEGGNPYAVTASNQTDQVTVSVDSKKGYAHAIVRGFYHKMDAPVQLPVPAVSTTTTYTVALKYDPTSTTSPVTLGIWTSLDRSNGRYYLVICQITRQPNQLLTNAKFTPYTPNITPKIQVDYKDNLPDPSTVLWGTEATCWRENSRYRATWNRWSPIGGLRVPTLGMGGWDQTLATDGILAQATDGGWDCRLTGLAARAAYAYTIKSWSTIGTILPAAYRPKATQYSVGLYGDNPIRTALDVNGQILIAPMGTGSLSISQGWSVTFNFAWFAPMNPTTAI